jgi:hypothetical protein
MGEYIDTGTPADIMRGQVTQTAGGLLQAPDSIILTPTAAKYIYNRLRSGSLKRMHLMAKIDNIINGEPPYDPEELREAKLDYIANVNMLDGRALYERAAQAYWNLTYQSQTLARIQYVTGSPDDADAEEILSQNYHDVLMAWPSFITLEGVHASNLVKYGLSCLIWPDEASWKWRVIEPYQFFIPDQTESDIEQMTVMCVETTVSIQYLFNLWQQFHERDETDIPWNIDELEHLIIRLANVQDKRTHNILNINEIMRRFYNGDMDLANIMSDEIQLISIYQKEYNNKISHFMMHGQFDNGKFLYKVLEQYKSFDEVFLIFSASAGEKTIHGNKGTGHKIYTSSQAIMRIDNSILDTSRLASTPVLSGPAGGAQDLQQIRFYPGVPTLIGTAVLQQNNFGTTIQQLVGASQFFTGKQNYNLGNSGDDPGQPDKSSASMSAEQFKFKSVDEFAIHRQVIYHYYNSKDRQHQNIVSKMLYAKDGDPDSEYAEDWKERCVSAGLPKEIFQNLKKSKIGVLPKGWKVKAARVVGDGSALAAILNLEQFRNLVPGLPAKGVRQFNRKAAIATVGPDHINTFLGDDNADAQSEGSSLAGAENALMRLGESPVFSPDNEHRAHFVTHSALAMWVIQTLEQQLQMPETGQTMDPIAADKIFANLAPHLQEHFQAEAQSGVFGANWAKGQEKNLKQIINFAQENKARAEQMLAADLKQKTQDQAATQTVMSDAQRKDFVVQKDEARKDHQIFAKEARQTEAQNIRGQTMRDKVLLDAGNKRLDIVLKNKVEAEKASADTIRENIQRMNGKTPATTDIEKPTT